MPNRVLRDWTNSDKINSVSVHAERFFTRLIMQADDFGRFHASPRLLSSYLFPLKDDMRDADITRCLTECEAAGLIVIDYVQLLNGDGDEGSREREVAKISRSLKRLAMELDIPIIALSQLNRTDGEKGVTWEYGPPTSSLRECGALEQDADLIMMLWGANEVEISNDSSLEGKRKVRIAKHRNGVLITDEFDFNSDIQRFEVAKKYEQQSSKQPAGNWRPVTSQEKNELEF